MKRSLKLKDSCFTVVAFWVFTFLFLTTAGAAQNSPAAKTQQDLRYLATQYKQIATDYLPGSQYEQAMNDAISKVEAMSQDPAAAQYLRPLIPSMLANLQTFRDALARLNKPQSQLYSVQAAGVFPNAVYPNVQLAGYPNFVLSGLDQIIAFPLAAISFFTTFQLPPWAPAELNGLPLTCLTPLDAEGNPIRVPDETMMALRLSVQIAEVIKEGADAVFEQVLELVGAGGNLKVLTIIPTGAYLLQKNIYENLKDCDDAIASAEATASYQRLGYIHGELETGFADMQNATDALAAALAAHDTSVNNRLSQHDADIKQLLSTLVLNQQQIYKLLKMHSDAMAHWVKIHP